MTITYDSYYIYHALRQIQQTQATLMLNVANIQAALNKLQADVTTLANAQGTVTAAVAAEHTADQAALDALVPQVEAIDAAVVAATPVATA